MTEDDSNTVAELWVGPANESPYKCKLAQATLSLIAILPGPMQRRAASSRLAEWAIGVTLGSRDVQLTELDEGEIPEEL